MSGGPLPWEPAGVSAPPAHQPHHVNMESRLITCAEAALLQFLSGDLTQSLGSSGVGVSRCVSEALGLLLASLCCWSSTTEDSPGPVNDRQQVHPLAPNSSCFIFAIILTFIFFFVFGSCFVSPMLLGQECRYPLTHRRCVQCHCGGHSSSQRGHRRFLWVPLSNKWPRHDWVKTTPTERKSDSINA